jgi:hypothetical protein
MGRLAKVGHANTLTAQEGSTPLLGTSAPVLARPATDKSHCQGPAQRYARRCLSASLGSVVIREDEFVALDLLAEMRACA